MEIRGYGEDAHTLLLLQDPQTLDLVLKALGIQASVDKCMAFYRPSFGRGSKGSATFGEFDAILLTPEDLLLVESKWVPVPKDQPATIHLAPAQVLRHGIFREYLDARFADRDKKFEELLGTIREALQPFHRDVPKMTGDKKPRLYQNLQDTLTMISDYYGAGRPTTIWNLVAVFQNIKGEAGAARILDLPAKAPKSSRAKAGTPETKREAVRIKATKGPGFDQELLKKIGEFHRVDISLGLEDPRDLLLHPR